MNLVSFVCQTITSFLNFRATNISFLNTLLEINNPSATKVGGYRGKIWNAFDKLSSGVEELAESCLEGTLGTAEMVLEEEGNVVDALEDGVESLADSACDYL